MFACLGVQLCVLLPMIEIVAGRQGRALLAEHDGHRLDIDLERVLNLPSSLLCVSARLKAFSR